MSTPEPPPVVLYLYGTFVLTVLVPCLLESRHGLKLAAGIIKSFNNMGDAMFFHFGVHHDLRIEKLKQDDYLTDIAKKNKGEKENDVNHFTTKCENEEFKKVMRMKEKRKGAPLTQAEQVLTPAEKIRLVEIVGAKMADWGANRGLWEQHGNQLHAALFEKLSDPKFKDCSMLFPNYRQAFGGEPVAFHHHGSQTSVACMVQIRYSKDSNVQEFADFCARHLAEVVRYKFGKNGAHWYSMFSSSTYRDSNEELSPYMAFRFDNFPQHDSAIRARGDFAVSQALEKAREADRTAFNAAQAVVQLQVDIDEKIKAGRDVADETKELAKAIDANETAQSVAVHMSTKYDEVKSLNEEDNDFFANMEADKTKYEEFEAYFKKFDVPKTFDFEAWAKEKHNKLFRLLHFTGCLGADYLEHINQGGNQVNQVNQVNQGNQGNQVNQGNQGNRGGNQGNRGGYQGNQGGRQV